MKDQEIIQEIDDVVEKLKCRIIYYQTENKALKEKILELKKFIRNKM